MLQLGIESRLRRLLQVTSDRTQQENIISESETNTFFTETFSEAYNMLVGDMGTKFKAMALFPKTLRSILDHRGGPAGFMKTSSK